MSKIRTEEEVKQLYAEYLIRQGKAHAGNSKDSDILTGMAIAYGRTLGLTMRRISIDVERFKAMAKTNEPSLTTLTKSL